MPDAKVSNQPSIVEARKRATKASKWLKAFSRASRIVKGKAPRVNKRGWLTKSPIIRKIGPKVPVGKMKRAGFRVAGAPSAVSMAPLKGVTTGSLVGSWDGVELIPVVSSNVASYAYKEEEATLIVAFLDGGIYEYYSVDDSIWQLFQTVSSKGRFVWTHLRDKYAYQRVV